VPHQRSIVSEPTWLLQEACALLLAALLDAEPFPLLPTPPEGLIALLDLKTAMSINGSLSRARVSHRAVQSCSAARRQSAKHVASLLCGPMTFCGEM